MASRQSTCDDAVYKWGTTEYTPLAMSKEDLNYPLIAKVKEGYYGNHWESLSSGEILLIHNCESQTRVIIKDSKGRHFSLAKSYNAKFYSVNKQGKRSDKKPKSLNDLLAKHKLPFDMEVEADDLTTGEAQSSDLLRLGHCTVTETYEEKFLKANLIRPEGLNKNVRKVATYVTAKLVVSDAPDLLKRCLTAASHISLDGINDEDQKIHMFTPTQIAQGGMEENIYETLEPNKFLSTQKVYETLQMKSSQVETIKMDVYSSVVDEIKTSRRPSIDFMLATNKPVVPIKPSCMTTPKKVASKSEQPSPATSTSASTDLSWKNLPREVKALSLTQVIQCLHLMNLGKYEKTFRENKVDGELLTSLDKDDLTTDLGLTGLDAKKILLFTRENWRPNETAMPLSDNDKNDTTA